LDEGSASRNIITQTQRILGHYFIPSNKFKLMIPVFKHAKTFRSLDQLATVVGSDKFDLIKVLGSEFLIFEVKTSLKLFQYRSRQS
jgi:hypothetical protein